MAVASLPAAAALRRAGPATPPASLTALLGPQRAAALLLLDIPRTAGEIARALHTVPGGATHHLRGLEAAGLVTRLRRGQYVIVERTPLGTALLGLYGDRAAQSRTVQKAPSAAVNGFSSSAS